MEAAAVAHRATLLSRFEALASSTSLLRKLINAVRYLRKNWGQFRRAMMASEKSPSPSYQDWRWRILCSTYVGYIGYYLTGKVLPAVKRDLAGIDLPASGDVAPLMAAFYFAYMIGQFLVSAVGRRTGARILLLIGLGVSIGTNGLCGAANSYATLMALLVVNGLAQSTGWPGSVGTVGEWLQPRGRAFVMGVWSTSLLVGNAAVKILSGYLLARWGWRSAYFGCSLFTLCIWAVLLVWQRDRPEDVALPQVANDQGETARPVRVSNACHIPFRQYFQPAVHPLVLLMGVGYFSIKFLRYSTDSWLPSFLQSAGPFPG